MAAYISSRLRAVHATEVVVDVPKAEDGDAYVIKVRFYLRRDQAGRDIWYKISVVGSPGADVNPDTARFLESFHFVAG